MPDGREKGRAGFPLSLFLLSEYLRLHDCRLLFTFSRIFQRLSCIGTFPLQPPSCATASAFFLPMPSAWIASDGIFPSFYGVPSCCLHSRAFSSPMLRRLRAAPLLPLHLLARLSARFSHSAPPSCPRIGQNPYSVPRHCQPSLRQRGPFSHLCLPPSLQRTPSPARILPASVQRAAHWYPCSTARVRMGVADVGTPCRCAQSAQLLCGGQFLLSCGRLPRRRVSAALSPLTLPSLHVPVCVFYARGSAAMSSSLREGRRPLFLVVILA